MTSVQVVEALDPLADPALRIVGIREAGPTEQLEAKRAEEALDHRVAPRVLLPAHAPLHAVVADPISETSRGGYSRGLL